MPVEDRLNLSVEVVSPGAILASARMLSGTPTKKKPKSEGWQEEAWAYYDLVGEFRYAANWLGNNLSKVGLEAAENDRATTNQAAIDAVNRIGGSSKARREILRQVGIHILVAGEVFIIGYEDNFGRELWAAISASELHLKKVNGVDHWFMGKSVNDGKDIGDALVIRVWRPHPRNAEKADAPSRGVLGVLKQIYTLDQYTNAQMGSRLTGNGILVVPDNIDFATPTKSNDQSGLSNAELFLQELMDTMSMAKENPDTPAAMVPILLQASSDAIDKIKHITFWTELDEKARDFQTQAIGRLALGLDMPPEILMGSADTNHWNAWKIDEEAIKVHIEPVAEILATSLTTGYLIPALTAADDGMDIEEAKAFAIVTNTTELRVRPNRSKEALELYEKGLVSAEVVLRENGFDPEVDAMDQSGRREWTMLNMLRNGQTRPEVVEEAVRQVGLVVPEALPPSVSEAQDVVVPRPEPTVKNHPTRNPPEEAPNLAAYEPFVFRALERAGNKIKSLYNYRNKEVAAADLYKHYRVDPDDMDSIMEDSWGMVSRSSFVLKKESACAALDAYARVLISSQREHNLSEMADFLSAAKVI